jgi:uncharacterized protein YecT (DUF1311 family)
MDIDAFFSRGLAWKDFACKGIACRGSCPVFLSALIPICLALSLFALSLSVAGPALAQQPGFDCVTNRAPDEVTICSNFALAQLDRQLTDLYAAARERLDASQQVALRDKQRLWLRQRAACGRDVGCMTRLYQERIPQLSALIVRLDTPSAPVQPPTVPPQGPALTRPSPGPGQGPAQGTRDACDMFPTLC